MNNFESILNLANLLDGIDSAISGGVHGFMAAIFALVAIAGLLQCLFGYKLMRVCFAVCGFGIGALGGLIGVGAAVSEPAPAIIAALICGILGAVLLFHVYRLGVFVMNFALVALLVILFGDMTETSLVVGIIAGLISGIIAAVMVRVWTILSTGVGGGIIAGIAIGSILCAPAMGAVLGFALAIGGCIFQFKTTGKKQKTAKTAPEVIAAPVAAPAAPVATPVETPAAPDKVKAETAAAPKAPKAEKPAAARGENRIVPVLRELFKALGSIAKNLVTILAFKLLDLFNRACSSLKLKLEGCKAFR